MFIAASCFFYNFCLTEISNPRKPTLECEQEEIKNHETFTC